MTRRLARHRTSPAPPPRSTWRRTLVDQACAAIRGRGGIDANQVVAYDVAHAAAAVAHGPGRPRVRRAGETSRRAWPRPSWPTWWPTWRARWPAARRPGGSSPAGVTPAAGLPGRLSAIRRCWPRSATVEGPRHLGDDFELVRETFHRFAEDKVRPHAEHVHRTNGDIPEEIIEGLAELGGFGLSVPEEYGGFASRAARATTWAWWWPPRS